MIIAEATNKAGQLVQMELVQRAGQFGAPYDGYLLIDKQQKNADPLNEKDGMAAFFRACQEECGK